MTIFDGEAGKTPNPFLANVPAEVTVVEVGPRDGLQNEAVALSTEDKIRLIGLLADAGCRDIEVTSFVSPGRVPQLADAEAVLAGLPEREGVRYTALVPNRQGLERALQTPVAGIAVFTAASETFNRKNIGRSIRESLDAFAEIIPIAKEQGLWVRGYVSTAFVCPYEGAIAPAAVVPVVRELIKSGVDEVSVGDTIGHATPTLVAGLTEALLGVDIPGYQLAYHFHDTRGMALANVLMALQYGIATFDSSAGGAGGCPFAPGAAGNVATEDLLTLLHGMGIGTGIDQAKVAEAARFLESKLGHGLPARNR